VEHGEDGGPVVKITILVEGRTEEAFEKHLRKYLKQILPPGNMPKLDFFPYHGLIPRGDELKRKVFVLLNSKNSSDHVIALTDVYTGEKPPCFANASDAKTKLRNWVGNESRFHPHAAQYDFEAWLLPYWATIKRLARHNKTVPSGNPELINHNNPPSKHIEEIFRIGNCSRDYSKPRDRDRILRENDLSVAIAKCSELKAFINTILSICRGQEIP
jgi:hypothetical protein